MVWRLRALCMHINFVREIGGRARGLRALRPAGRSGGAIEAVERRVWLKLRGLPQIMFVLFLGTLYHHISQHTHESTHYILVNLLQGEGEVERERERERPPPTP